MQLEEIPTTDLRGIAFTAKKQGFYTISSSNGQVYNYQLPNDGEVRNIPTYRVDQVVTRKEDGQPDFLGVYASVVGIVNSQNFSEDGLDFSMESGDRGIAVFANSALGGKMPQKGDSIAVVGRIGERLGLIRIEADSMRTITPQTRNIAYRLVERLGTVMESLPVQINEAVLNTPENWGNTVGFLGFEAKANAGGQEFGLFVDRQSPVFVQNSPEKAFNARGVVRRVLQPGQKVDLAIFAEELMPSNILGLSEKEVSQAIQLYPNPLNSEEGYIMTVASQWFKQANPNFQVVSVAGKALPSLWSKAAAGEYRLNMARLPHGMYYLKIQWNGREIVKSFVK